MKTQRPHTNVAPKGAAVALRPVLGAKLFDKPAFYSRLCGHQLREEDKHLDGGDPSCFAQLLARFNAFAQQLRTAGQLRAAAGVVLRLAGELAKYTADATLLRVHQNGRHSSDRERQREVAKALDCLSDTMTNLCLVVVDDRLSCEVRTALGGQALCAASALFSADMVPDLCSKDAAFFNAHSMLAHEASIVLWYPDFHSDAPVLLHAARVLAQTSWDHPLLLSAMAGNQSSFWPLSSQLQAPILDLHVRCRYLLERGRLQECENLSRLACDVSTLAAAVQELQWHVPRALAARFWLHNTNRVFQIHSVYTSYAASFSDVAAVYNRTSELEYLYKVGEDIFGPVAAGPRYSNGCSPDRVREIAFSVLAARVGWGQSLSLFGEIEPASAEQYEMLLVVCILRLVALACIKDALRLVIVLLEMDGDVGGKDVTTARRKFCAAILFKRDFLRTKRHSVEEEYDELLEAPLIVAAMASARGSWPRGKLIKFVHGSAAWKHAVAHARALDLLNAAFDVLPLCGDTVSASALECIFAGHASEANRREPVRIEIDETRSAAEEIVAVSRSSDGFMADMFLTAASLAVACLFSYTPDHGAFAESLNLLDRIAPRLSELWGFSTHAVGVQTLRRRVFGHCLARYEAPAEELTDSAFNARSEQYLALLQKFVDCGNSVNDISPFVDYFMAAKIGIAFLSPESIRTFIGKFKRTCLFSLWMLRLTLGEIGERLQHSTSRSAELEEERADALRLAELVWEVCPCVQAARVVRKVLTASDEGSGERWERWLQEIRTNVALVHSERLPIVKEDDDENPKAECGLEESRRAARLTLAAVALYLADENDEFDLGKALGVDFAKRPSGVIPMITLFARWRQLARNTDMHKDRWIRNTHDNFWQGRATLEYAVARLDDFCKRSGLLIQQLYGGNGGGPDGRDAVIVDDRFSVEQLQGLCDAILDHQEVYMQRVDDYASAPNGCDDPGNCVLCKNAWDPDKVNWRLHSLPLLAPPLLQLFVDTFLRMPEV
eukprot:tig00000093_g3642.t1